MVSSIRMHKHLHENSFKHWKFCYCSCPEVSLSGLSLASDAESELISLIEQQDTWTWGNIVVWLPGHICFRSSQLSSDCDYLLCRNSQQIARLQHRGISPSICLSHSSWVITGVLNGFSVLYSLLFSVLDFRECVLYSHPKDSVTTGISFRSHQAETGLFGGENVRSIVAISAATVALIRTEAKITPTEVIRQEVSPWEMDLNVTVLQTAIGLLSFLTQTGSQWSYVHSTASPKQSLRNQRFSSIMLHVWEMPAVCQEDGDLSVSP